MSSSAKRGHTPPPPLSQILPQPDVELGTAPVPEDAMEVTSGSRSERRGHHPEANPPMVTPRRPHGARHEACGKSGKSP